MKITYIGHATLLLEIHGVRLLTDPNFDSALGCVLSRIAPPGIALRDLPAIDAVLLTHAHADHLSFASLAALSRDIPLYAPGPVAQWLQRKGYHHATPLDPGAVAYLHAGDVRIHAARAEHNGSRYGVDVWRKGANMYLLESDTESIFFAGDTARTATTHQMVEDVLWVTGRSLDVALLPIGFAPAWKPGFRRGHLTSDDALRLFDTLGADVMIPYHWGTFNHVTAGAYDAIQVLRDALHWYSRAGAVHILNPGDGMTRHERER